MLVKKIGSNEDGDKYLVTLDIIEIATFLKIPKEDVVKAVSRLDDDRTYYGTCKLHAQFIAEREDEVQSEQKYDLNSVVLRLSDHKPIRVDATDSIITVAIITMPSILVGDISMPGCLLVPNIGYRDATRLELHSNDAKTKIPCLLGFDLILCNKTALTTPGVKYPVVEEPRYHIKTCDFGFGIKVHYAILPEDVALSPNTGYVHAVTVDDILVGRQVGDVRFPTHTGAIDAVTRVIATANDNPRLTTDMVHRLNWLAPESQSVSWHNSTLDEVEYKKLFKFTRGWLTKTEAQ